MNTPHVNELAYRSLAASHPTLSPLASRHAVPSNAAYSQSTALFTRGPQQTVDAASVIHLPRCRLDKRPKVTLFTRCHKPIAAATCRASLAYMMLSIASLCQAADAAPSTAERQAPRQAPIVFINGGRLTVFAEEQPVDRVIKAIGDKAGFSATFNGDFSGKVSSWSFRELPLIEGIMRLAGSNSIVVQTRTTNSAQTVVALTVFATNPKESSGSSLSPSPWQHVAATPKYADAADMDSVTQRILAVERLAGLESQDVIERLEQVLTTDPALSARLAALSVLQDIGGEAIVASIAKGMGDHDPAMRVAVLQSLTAIGGHDAIMVLGQAIMGDHSANVRRAAVIALDGQSGGPAEAFVKAALHDRSPSVRQAAKGVATATEEAIDPRSAMYINHNTTMISIRG